MHNSQCNDNVCSKQGFVIFSSGSTTSDNFKSVGVGGAIECEVEELEKLILDLSYKKERMRAERSRKSFFNFLKK